MALIWVGYSVWMFYTISNDNSENVAQFIKGNDNLGFSIRNFNANDLFTFEWNNNSKGLALFKLLYFIYGNVC